MSIDGYLDDASRERLVLSNEADLDRVDEVRAGCDAILVGAATVRNDDPRLLVRATRPPRRAGRPRAAAVAGQGHRDRQRRPRPGRALLPHRGHREARLLRARSARRGRATGSGAVATVVDAGRRSTMRRVAEDLHARGVRRLMVEGGGTVHTQFLTGDLADELQLVVAPFFVGDSRGPPVRRRRHVPVEPGPPRHAGRRPPDRRRRPAALRAVRPLRAD